ncbi:MAG: tRNA (N6-threonylcarbamoyladenosine(37)-N6)-methyltransferase TrmO [Oscillospiraceae bacterium]|nr:tRNA (N6-threonylcarbamoyladenosine(37)-N6)-methyltransferase TrmO [Oscillospiraceae bacterium]
MEQILIRPIAVMHTDLPDKFGVPRQAGIVEELEGTIIFEPEFRVDDALRGIEEFSHLWIIWQFHKAVRSEWSPTVRPPRLGGNVRMGVFATRSPFRPNNIAMSCVRLLGVERTAENGTVLRVAGVDMMDGTPILDIKPYIPYADSHPEASSGFAPDSGYQLEVNFAPGLEEQIPEEKRAALRGVLENDPRPRYQNDSERVYGMDFGGMNIRFRVEENRLLVTEIIKL